MHTKQLSTSLRFGVAVLLLARLGGLAQTYTLTDLGPGSANGINDSGLVVGSIAPGFTLNTQSAILGSGGPTVTLTTSPFFWVDPSTPQHRRRLYRAVAAP